jgi:EAL domain-containing protein (putative c-di-GMP-specific phosphodiesterase class I)
MPWRSWRTASGPFWTNRLSRKNYIVPKPETNLLLAVDDERDFLELVAELAQGVGYQVLTADTAEGFRDLYMQHRPSLVLLDLQMPGMDGVEALRYLARQNTQTGIVLASGMDQRVLTSARQLGESLGLKMLGILQKPALVEDIEGLLMKHLSADDSITVADVRRAVDEYELVVHYQPKLQRVGRDWRVSAAEALVRWQHPQRGLLFPSAFLSLAEENGLIPSITDFVLTDAIRQVGHWRARGLNLGVAVNLAPRLVKDLEFPDRLTRILREYEVPAEQLTLDVTEAASLYDWDVVMDSFTRLRVRGVGLALDDFGVGTSSLTQLYKLPFSEVKIDRALIVEVPGNRAASVITRSIIELSHNLSLSACAEGVETAEAFDFLDQGGCDALQGDFISKAIPAAEVEFFIAAWSGGRALDGDTARMPMLSAK